MIVLTELLAQRTPVSHLIVHAIDMGTYLVEVETAAGTDMLCEQPSRPLAFRSVEQVRRRLQGLPVARATLLHASAYGEMVGLPEENVPPLELPLAWPQSA